MQKYLFYFTALYILCKCLQVKADGDGTSFREGICNTVIVRTINDFNGLQNCTVVTGSVQLVEIDFDHSDWEEVKSSNVEEISSYLLVYHVNGLDSLERLFPKLIVIRGVELLYDEYALVVLENRNLQNIGLVSLLRVLRGSVRIEHNPSLCFINTVNWVWILGNETKQYYIDVKRNRPPNECPLCYTYEDELEVKEVNRHKRCWSHNKFQKTILDHVGEKSCKEKTNCLTSCSQSKCRYCTNYISDKGCVDMCLPPKYRLAFKRQCVTNCTQWGLFQLGLECVEECPMHYQAIKVNGVDICALNCLGNFVIHNTKDLDGLSECTKIDGSLTIEIHETDKPIVENLENAFRNLNVITGYLKILNSPQIISLHFFKNLHTIGGSELLENRYSVYVVNNHHMQQLWLKNVIIAHGCVYFHLNPHLCYSLIVALQKNFKECTQITITDASTNSNGEREVCEEDIRATNATVKDVNSDSVLIEVDALTSTFLELLVGYAYYYKEAPFKNVSKYDGRHGCGRDSWFTDLVLKIHRRHIIKNLKPGTQYAYFVNSLTMLDYPYVEQYVSEIRYFKTLPTTPEMVAKLYYHSMSVTEIEVHWWPPRITNGILEKYILQYEITDTKIPSEMNSKNATNVCQCPKLDTESNLPTPHVEDYYSKEKLLYLNSVMNFIYVKKKRVENATNANDNSTAAANATAISTTIAPDTTPSSTTTTTTTSTTTTDSAISNTTATAGTDNTTGIQELSLQEIIRDWQKKMDLEAIVKQDKDKENYVIPHADPICNQINPSMQDQTESKCIPLERFEGGIEIPPQRHSYVLNNLKAGKTYRLSLRACVKDLINGCGPARVIFARTVSKSMESMIESLSFNKLGMIKK